MINDDLKIDQEIHGQDLDPNTAAHGDVPWHDETWNPAEKYNADYHTKEHPIITKAELDSIQYPDDFESGTETSTQQGGLRGGENPAEDLQAKLEMHMNDEIAGDDNEVDMYSG
ncbi:unnamed protein product [Amoebophrya sp. A120]|nr:unnamed protein product [Amoebophrya sp. A120]CAD7975890.1 unnamed protein product [Amoebophrya sp. A120]|eukprot:GSA120T00026254001.1